MARGYWGAEQGADVSTTSTSVWQNAVSVTASLPANSRFLVMWSGLGGLNANTVEMEARLYNGTTNLGYVNWARLASSPNDFRCIGGLATITTTTAASVTLTMDCKLFSGSATVTLRDCSIIILQLDDADVVQTDSGGATPYSLTASIPVFTPGEYLLLWAFNLSGTAIDNVDVTVDGASVYQTRSVFVATVSPVRYPWMRGIRVDLAAGTHQAALSVATADLANLGNTDRVVIAAIRLEELPAHHYAHATIPVGSETTEYVDVVTLQAQTAASDHLVIGAVRIRTDNTAVSSYAQLTEDGASVMESPSDHPGNDYDVPRFSGRLVTLTAEEHIWKWQRKSAAGSAETSGDGFLIAIQLEDQPVIEVVPEIPVARDTIHVVDVTVAPVDLTPTLVPQRSPAVGVGAVGVGAVAAPVPAGLLPVYDDPVEEVRHFADVDWTTIPADGAAVFHDGRAIQALEMERTIPLSPHTVGRNTFGTGRVHLANADRGLRDTVLGYSVDGRIVEVLAGSPTASKATFTRLFRGIADFWGPSTATEIIVDLRDRWRKLTTDPRPLFRGTGGIDGPPELQDKPKPLWVGWRANVPATYITDDPMPIWMVSGWPMSSIDYVNVRGAAITIEDATTDIFNASPPTLGQTLICPHNIADGCSYVGFASQPDGAVTIGGRGATVGGVGGVYMSRTTDIARWLLSALGGLSGDEFDFAAWAALRRRWPGEVGAWFGTETTTVLEMMAAIMAPTMWWGDDSEGRVTCGTLDLPAKLGTPLGTLSADEIIENSVDRQDWPGGAPWKRATVLYDTNNMVQVTDVAEADQAWLAYIQQPGRTYGPDNVPVRTAHVGAIIPDAVRTPFRLIYDAAEVQQIIAALNSGAVNLWRVEVPDDRIRFPIGHVLYLDHPAVSDSAVPALVAGVTLNAATRRVTYLLVA